VLVVGLFKGTMRVHGDAAGSCDWLSATRCWRRWSARAIKILAGKPGEFGLRCSIVRELICVCLAIL
jgi:hypothetical protein